MAAFYWTLIIVMSSGIISSDTKLHSIPMMTKQACIKAGNDLNKNSKNVGFICVGSENGEIELIK